MTTVKEIHAAFKAEVSQMITGSQYEALKVAGFKIAPTRETAAAFPLNKLIHINTILHLCEKYNLVFASTSSYIGTIPTKNLQELENFVNTHNYTHVRQTRYNFVGISSAINNLFVKETEKGSFKKAEYSSVLNWMIVAPKELIVAEKPKQTTVSDVSASIKRVREMGLDPIIIAMIRDEFWGRAEWGAIVTAWGDEASDEAVVNEKMN